jgi:DNA-binding MarR family transcriptional regulator
MLTAGEVRALTSLHGERTVSEFATRLDRSLSYTSELVDRLEATGLLKMRRQGKTKRVRPSDAKALELLTEITQEYSHIEWPELLSGAALRVLYHLGTPRAATDLARHADVHRSTVHRVLDPLQHRGIIYITDDDGYALNEGFEQLSTLARELAHHDHRQTVEQHTDTYTILWESLDEFLAQTADEITAEDFIPTGPARFQTYDLPLLTRDRRYYLYSATMTDLSPETLCCHMLVIDSGPRAQSYCLLLLSHVDVDRNKLRNQATQYGVDDLVEDLLTYLDTGGEQRTARLPEWEDFQELAADYGVTG